MAVDWIYLQRLDSSIAAKLACAGSVLPFALRTADYYTLQAEGTRLLDEIRAVVALREGSSQVVRDDVARRAWVYHVRLDAYLAAVEDTQGCSRISFGIESPDLDPPPDSAVEGGGVGPGLVWGGVLLLSCIGAGWALTR